MITGIFADNGAERLLQNKFVNKMKVKSEVIRTRAVIRVPKPFNEEEPGLLYRYGALQAFDRRAFVRFLEEGQEKRQAAGGHKESKIVSAAEDDSIYAIFEQCDSDGSGEITREELVRNCAVLNLSIEEAHHLFDKLDADGSGTIDMYEFAQAVEEIENSAVSNLVQAMCEGDAGRLHDGLMRHTKTKSYVDPKRLNVRCVVNPATGEGALGTCPLISFPNQNGDLGRRLGGDETRRIPRCSHVATEELEITSLGVRGHGIASGLFLVEGDTLLHAVMRNAHLSRRCEMATALLDAGADPNAVSSDGKRPFELDLQGRRHVWKRDDVDLDGGKKGKKGATNKGWTGLI